MSYIYIQPSKRNTNISTETLIQTLWRSYAKYIDANVLIQNAAFNIKMHPCYNSFNKRSQYLTIICCSWYRVSIHAASPSYKHIDQVYISDEYVREYISYWFCLWKLLKSYIYIEYRKAVCSWRFSSRHSHVQAAPLLCVMIRYKMSQRGSRYIIFDSSIGNSSQKHF